MRPSVRPALVANPSGLCRFSEALTGPYRQSWIYARVEGSDLDVPIPRWYQTLSAGTLSIGFVLAVANS